MRVLFDFFINIARWACVFYRVLVKIPSEHGSILKDENDEMSWTQEGTKNFGAWAFIGVRDTANYDDGLKYKEVPY